MTLESCVFCSPDYFILELFAQVVKIITVPCYTDYQIPVLFGMLLGITQGFRIYNIELDMVPVHPEIASDEVDQTLLALIVFKELGCELLVKQRTSGFDMIHLCC